MSKEKFMELDDYVGKFRSKGRAAKSLNISPQALHYNLMNQENYIVYVDEDNISLMRIISKVGRK